MYVSQIGDCVWPFLSFFATLLYEENSRAVGSTASSGGAQGGYASKTTETSEEEQLKAALAASAEEARQKTEEEAKLNSELETALKESRQSQDANAAWEEKQTAADEAEPQSQDAVGDEFFLTDESHHDVNRRFEEQIDIVIAAFDEDGDGCLNLAETRALVRASYGQELPGQVFTQICESCVDVGAEAATSLDREALVCIYSCGNAWMILERDFEAAKRKLMGVKGQPKADGAIGSMLKNPLLAGPYALDVAERLRQGVASQIQ